MALLTLRIEIPDYAAPSEVFALLDKWQAEMEVEDVSLESADWCDGDNDTHYWNP